MWLWQGRSALATDAMALGVAVAGLLMEPAGRSGAGAAATPLDTAPPVRCNGTWCGCGCGYGGLVNGAGGAGGATPLDTAPPVNN